MRLPALISAFLAGAATIALASEESTRTAAIYIQPLANPSTPPALLAEIAIPDIDSPSSSATPNSQEGDDDTPAAVEVLSYSAPELPDDDDEGNNNNLVRIGIYSPSAGAWVSSTSVASTANFAKGYAPHFAVTVDGDGAYVGVVCRGVAIDAGVTRDFGPQVVVLRTAPGAQPALGKPVVLSPEGRKVPEGGEKSFLQKYWWVLAIGVLVATGYGPLSLGPQFSSLNSRATNSTDPMGATNPENGGATATDLKGKGRAPAAQEPVEDTSMAEDDDDDDDEEDPEEEPEAADDDNMEEIDLDNVIGRRTRGKVIDFANAAQENPADDDDEEDDDDFVEDDNKMDDSKMDED
ncbi:hypothetical protein CHGG_10377 [Chaetomium globosum CBS 148.51]|uniref:uncharacterized protein n=1 Tax=Chaetomium globosum (strain ATCC 6205 / CBS 148.51 / DSM 1962 / NBRC 6347 / NRRL 1970) TaxID=306901 RepID=UPI00006AAEAD|nr:uncharacterized protein CHGG_10377 [Chaetomium globosum CBS 148.51]EAQ83973.1 hypothetical protein CHGG_10377 [Chaetomium globosum CBS 148.51]